MCSDSPMITWEIQSQVWRWSSLFEGSCCDWSAKGDELQSRLPILVSLPGSAPPCRGVWGRWQKTEKPCAPHTSDYLPPAASQISIGISQVSLLNPHQDPQEKGVLERHSDILDLEAKKHQSPGKGPGIHPSEKHLFSFSSFFRKEERDVDSNGNRYEWTAEGYRS